MLVGMKELTDMRGLRGGEETDCGFRALRGVVMNTPKADRTTWLTRGHGAWSSPIRSEREGEARWTRYPIDLSIGMHSENRVSHR